jgi:hypothetical protein
MPTCTAQTKRGARCTKLVGNEGDLCVIHQRAQPLVNLSRDLNSENPRTVTEALRRLSQTLINPSSVDSFLRTNTLGRILELVFSDATEDVKYQALSVLINLSSAPGDTGSHAIWRAREDIVEEFEDLMMTEGHRITGSVMWCLANIASSVPDYALEMIEHTFQNDCLTILQNGRTSNEYLKNASFLLMNLADRMNQETAVNTLTGVSRIPSRNLISTESLTDLIWTIQKLFSITNDLCGISPAFLVRCLEYTNSVVQPALRIIGDISSSDDSQLINTLLRQNLISALQNLLLRPYTPNNVLWVLSNLAVEPYGGLAIVNQAGLLLDVARRATRTAEAIWVLSNLVKRGSSVVIGALIRCGCGLAFLNVLKKERIDLISKKLCLESLESLIEKGGARACLLLHTNGCNAIVERFLTGEDVYVVGLANRILEHLRALSFIQIAAAPPTAAPAPNDYVPTSGALLAVARMTEMLSRGVEPEPVPVDDLLFTAGDVSYLVGQGYKFNGGSLVSAPY